MRKWSYLLSIFLVFACEKQDLPFDSSLSSEQIITLGGSRNDVAQSIISTSDGGFAVLGYTQSTDSDISDKSDESYDFWLLKFDASANLEWSKTYGGSADDRGFSLIQTSDNGFALLGYTASSDGDISMNNGSRDFWLVKTDAQGTLLWEKTYGFSGLDQGTHIIESSDGHFIISGVLDVTASAGDGNFGRGTTRHAGGDYWLLKVTQTGDLVWSRYYGGSFTDVPYGFVETTSGNFLVTGSSDSNDVDINANRGSYDFWTVLAGSNGDLISENSYGGAEIDEARGIVNSNDGNFVIVGDTRSNDQDVTSNNGAADLWLIKTTETGEIIWNRSIGGTNFDVPRSIQSTSDGGFVIAGSSRSSDGQLSTNQGQNDAWIIRTNGSGELISTKTFGGSEIDFGYDAVQLQNGSFILVGESNSNDGNITENKGFTDLLIIKTDL